MGDWHEAIEAKLDETVQLHRLADVPIGAFLSGGIDSGAIVASHARTSREPIQTFSIGFREAPYSELPHARRVAEMFCTRHVEEIVTPDAVTLLDELSRYFDEPFADPSAIPTFILARLASRYVKVALSGDGGDEAFGGYERYAHDLWEDAGRRYLPAWFRRSAVGPIARFWPRADWLPRPFRLKTTLSNVSMDAGDAYANTITQCRAPLRRRLIAPDLVDGLNDHDPLRLARNGFANAPAGDVLGGMIAADVATVLPDDFLVKVDRASMAHGLEVRPPLLDHELLELAAGIPSRWKVRRGKTKWLFRQLCRRRLPADLVDRPKQGFDLPIDEWLRGPLRPHFISAVLDPKAPVAALINQKTARALDQSHRAGTGRHGKVLWSLLVLAHWANRYLDPTSSHTELATFRNVAPGL